MKGLELPHSKDVEMLVLGGALSSEQCLLVAMELVSPEDFLLTQNQRIFSAIRSVYLSGLVVDRITVAEQLISDGKLDLVGGVSYLAGLEAVPTLVNYRTYVDKLLEYSRLRKALMIFHDAAQRIQSSRSVDEIDRAVLRLGEVKSGLGRGSGPETPGQIIERSGGKDGYLCLSEPAIETGLVDCDRLTGGLRPGEVTVVAARPSTGKTALALTISRRVARQYPVLLFSLEMPKRAIMDRLIAQEGMLDLAALRSRNLSDEDRKRAEKAIERLSGLRLMVDDRHVGVAEIEASSEAAKANGGLGLVVIDYLQLIEERFRRYDSRVHELAVISRSIKRMAMKIQVPILVLSQMSRAVENRADKRPQLSDLRDSGAIEQDADIVIFLVRNVAGEDSADESRSSLVVLKNRNGQTGVVPVIFLKKMAMFANLAEPGRLAPAARTRLRYVGQKGDRT